MVDHEKALERLKSFIDGEIEGKDRVKCPEIAHAAVEHFRNDDEVLAALIYPATYDLTRLIVRSAHPGEAFYTAEGELVAGEEVIIEDEENRSTRSVFSNWFASGREYNGVEHVRVMRMTKADCLAVADIRFKRARTEHVRAMLYQRIERVLRRGEVIEDRFTPEQLKRMEETIDEELYGEKEEDSA